MRVHPYVLCAILGFGPLITSGACKLAKYAELPVTMSGMQPLLAGSINGGEAQFLADSGYEYSVISREIATKYHLSLSDLTMGMRMRGVGDGDQHAQLGVARDFTLTGLGPHVFHHVEFVVLDDAPGVILGQNLLRNDVEYDLGGGYIRLFKDEDCSDRVLAYWADDKASIAVEKISNASGSMHLVGEAMLNGTKIRVVFDSGAARSILTRKIAERTGIRPDTPGVESAGLTSGIASRPIETWIGRFASFEIGGEQVQNAKLRFGDIELGGGADMLLGADFFLSHRLFVASSQHTIYFTYNGGRVFDLSVSNGKGATAQILRHVRPDT